MARQTRPQPEAVDPADEVLRVVAERLRDARMKAGLTQAQLGNIAGVRQSYVGELEQANSNITLRTLVKMAGFLKVSPRDLLPEGSYSPPSQASIDRLIVVLERLSGILSRRSEQDAELLAELRMFVGLRDTLANLARDGLAGSGSSRQTLGSSDPSGVSRSH